MSHKKAHKTQKFIVRFSVFVVLFCGGTLQGQQAPFVYLTFNLRDFKLKLLKTSQTVAALEPKSAAGFDFTPGDRLEKRAANGYHHLGDLTLRVRIGTSGPWQKYDTAESRKPVEPVTAGVSTLVAADLSPTLPADIPLKITRSWIIDNGRLVLSFELKNKTTQPVQLGALGIPMIFNNIITGRNLKEAHERCSLADPYIGQDAGYLQVTRLSGHGPALVVVPDGQTPLEAYQPLTEPTRPSQTFKGALEVNEDKPTREWKAYSIRGKTWGRARLTLTYDDNSTQSISYYVIKPSTQAVTDLGHFLFTRQWFDDPSDPFHRSPSIMSYDRETNKIVTQDSRVWIAGLGDEGGSGSWLAAVMKQFGQPRKEEIAKYEQFIDRVLWGGIQYKDGPNKYGVRKSLFYYSPQDMPGYKYEPALDWTTWTSWKKADAESIERGYNYPHVIAAYWSMYRLARNHKGLVTNHSWDWYLDQAYETTKFMFSRQPNGRRRVGYVELGLMEGDIILALLEDLKREAWQDKANDIERLMKERAERWKQEPYPFGSEMAWDSTGQEEVYAWCKYFGYDDKALVSLNSIIGYMPTLPHWGYNTGDYGPNFFGHAFNTATYVINHPEFGWQSFGGNVSVNGDWVNVQPLDSFRRRVYIASLGLWLTLDAGTFERVALNTRSNVVRITLSPANAFTPNARLRVQQPAKLPAVGTYAPRQKFVNERDAFTIPLGRSPISIELSHKKALKKTLDEQ